MCKNTERLRPSHAHLSYLPERRPGHTVNKEAEQGVPQGKSHCPEHGLCLLRMFHFLVSLVTTYCRLLTKYFLWIK